jgi:hypothetical protein
MKKTTKQQRAGKPKTRLGLPDLDHSKAAVIGSLRSPESQRGYTHAINEFIGGIAQNHGCRSIVPLSYGIETTSNRGVSLQAR